MSNHVSSQDPANWSLVEGGTLFPFVEDENFNITGLGHQDPEAFADAVNRYDTALNAGVPLPPDSQWGPEHIQHRWAVLEDVGDILIHDVPEGTEGAVPITTLWGERG